MGGTAASSVTSGVSGSTGTTLGASGGLDTHTLTTAQLALMVMLFPLPVGRWWRRLNFAVNAYSSCRTVYSGTT
jgi:hypothetical protein